jgi:tRNA(Ile)-lysidine synthase
VNAIAEQINRFFEQHNIAPEARLLLACSGGLDSVVLFHQLHNLQRRFVVVHCNFSLRGEESDGDETFVRTLAAEHGTPCHVKRFDTRSYAAEQNLSIQMAARRLRYAYFEAVCAEEGYDYILTAHHLNDSFETFLINLGRGTGVRGLKGVPSSKGKVLRPMHQCTRSMLLAYAREAGLRWREDSSNLKTDYQRNKLRHGVLPTLLASKEAYSRGFQKSLQHLDEAARFAEAQAGILLKEWEVRKPDGSYALYTNHLLNTPGFGFVLHQWLAPFGQFDEQALHQALLQPKKQYFDSATHELIVEKGYIWLQPKRPSLAEIVIRAGDEHVLFGDVHFSFSKTNTLPDKEALKKAEHGYLDYHKLRFPLRLRNWKEGDSFVPFGMKGSKNLSDFLSEQGLNALQKSRVPLLVSGNDIVWVCGYRINDNYKVTERSNSLYFGRFLKQHS